MLLYLQGDVSGGAVAASEPSSLGIVGVGVVGVVGDARNPGSDCAKEATNNDDDAKGVVIIKTSRREAVAIIT